MNGFSKDNFAEVYQNLIDKVEEAEESETPYILKTLSHKKDFALEINSLQNFYAIPQTETKTHMPITKDSIRTYLRTGEISDWKPYLTAIAQHLIDDFGYKKQILANEKKNFVFIIDEINRGDMSKSLASCFSRLTPVIAAQKNARIYGRNTRTCKQSRIFLMLLQASKTAIISDISSSPKTSTSSVP